MGLILDTSILIESERRGEAIEDILQRLRTAHGEIDIALSTVSVAELTHGIYRAKTEARRPRSSTRPTTVSLTLHASAGNSPK